ncbi:multifunctional oxoglutarate decarboxylase/oxoglutarate dehydrogenase thiamine pyrophosphate-binding subunit/dihydrolipoyllysine-residue succinyltransferase subunit [Amycolatopsis acidiphila]|uniref:Multifunctional oxoglutarate decarboxylase/oxoglutarate dehydrogenase thiamine pyrophosphate-binding subunit/dihydrolipoyllysine-residue succinyltransferase subunit n=1 Tax=Amycolatopsis acidiphila TaxID=715473 RepID=A0A558A1P0_9PSEU|nr:multifunctional oxoglutarate decarboxylase/oxoglutarate dehydrogenase thiamine pyrophosphate-binding subunit/dihydrolipoyllysine-residue succinyltransferase subunit [Amycolatopsis acidiphila]TVT18179.1 multifunctional oxoglutarate decarboxylase/oxoglutarate dehydrogenase thiamine pyrophosphate-binding subunit/dihydrolipoyllysine-residue succinyltransferase subunit [Amycolatopsis acidiphila]UIJ58870.1 multifunctional oxoglutarate decarboxylase/oxoglutarate dehydrogenase thiamine pyrophosphate-b
MSSSSPASQFGPNEWLVEEMYDQFLADPSSVDAAWHDFFSDFKPTQTPETKPDTAGSSAPAAQTPPPKPSTNGKATTAKTAAQSAPAAKPQPATAKPQAAAAKPATDEETKQLRGAAAAIAKNMDASLSVPTATSVRAVPAKLMADNRIVINNHLKRTRGGKISFTHLIGYAMVRALHDYPNMNRHYQLADGKPFAVTPEHVNLGLAIDMKGKDGSRTLVVASIKNTENMSFLQFWQAYEDIVKKARNNKLTADDFAGTTISLTNPGGIGTNHSVPRLQAGQGAIIGVGAMQYPAHFEGTSEKTLIDLGISKIMTLTSTYDHRIIQGAESGEFLKRIHELLLGEDGFYDDIFTSLRLPYEPIRWVADIPAGAVDKTARVLELIDAYRMRGHLMADTDPLNYRQRRHEDLDVLSHGLTLWDLDREFAVGGFAGQERMKLRDILGVLRDSYCRTVGIEYTHILDPEERRWIQERVEVPHAKPDPAVQKYVLSKLNAAEAFETFLQTKYVGQKRFSLEGGETVIPLLDTVLDKAAEHELDEVVIGMPHRGRLNVLANIVGKPISQIFREFEGNLDPGQAHGSGDVKYHLGAEGKYFRMFGDGETKVSLASNPSHLETVDPVLEGIVRAKQDILDKGDQDGQGFTVLPVLMHGDAAFAGQGVVAETLNLALLRGYRTGGSVHLIINNQVGFTTAPEHARSSQYATDVAKMIGAPIFHVNGDDPEAAHWVAKLAVDYRQAFNKDVVIDMICYRRRGHNEGDDPSMTQPAMYDIIDTKRSVRKTYTEALIGRGDISVDEAEAALRDFSSQLEHVFNEVRELEKHPAKASPSVEEEQQVPAKVPTAVAREVIERIGDAFLNVPEGFSPHPRVKPVLERRAKMSREGGIDWAFGELLAFGSLAMEGRLVRLSGQDSRRGTFTQRHSVLIDRKSGQEYAPLQSLTDDQARVMIYDSALSEYAAVGFEYGYSVANSEALVLWEAQFGDFVNGAQTVIDEYISSGEAKWGQLSDVVLLLPHGHEGQGPDHTSGRIERFLQLCAEGSMTVAVPSTPANYFHLLRRHALDGIRRPMIVFTPKSMLRNKAATSAVEDFVGQSKFMSVIDDKEVDPAKVRKVLLTSGKLYWELVAERTKREANDVAIVRIEQYYPLPTKKLRAALERYTAASKVSWVQEEPENQGGWPFFGLHLPRKLPELLSGLDVVSRRPMAAPSAGSSKVHEVEQKALIAKAFE